ncbi:MAG: hypothetical protein AB7P99_20170 [Vicinamibacterales bacterium]
MAGLHEIETASTLWRFVIRRGDPPRVRRAYHRADSPGYTHRWRTLGRLGFGHIIHFHRAATFVLDVAGQQITAFQRRGQSREEIQQLLVAQVLPLVLGLGGRVVLHASAAVSARGALAFVGAPRQGKSSIALALAARGYAVAADDCLVIDPRRGCRIVPVDVGVRLWPDAALRHGATSSGQRAGFAAHARGKRRVPLADLGIRGVARRPVLRRLYLLNPGGRRVSSAPVAPREAVIRLLEASFQLDHDAADAMRQAFENLTRVVEAVEVRRLSYPRSPTCLPEIVRTLEADG